MFQVCVEAPKLSSVETKESQCQFINLPLSLGCKRIDEISREVVKGIQNRLKVGFDCTAVDHVSLQSVLANLQRDLQQCVDETHSGNTNGQTDNNLKEILFKSLNFLKDVQGMLNSLDQDRISLQTEQRKLESARKKVLASLVPMSNNGEDSSTWEIEDGPSWSSYAIATNELVESSGPISIGPQYLPASRPPSRPASRPHSRSHSITREQGIRSPNGVVMREHAAGQGNVSNGIRPRSANMSPQRWTVVSPSGTLSNSSPSHGIKSKIKARTGSISPTGNRYGTCFVMNQIFHEFLKIVKLFNRYRTSIVFPPIFNEITILGLLSLMFKGLSRIKIL